MIAYKEHFTKKGNVLAACDYELLNKLITQGDVELFLSNSFYGDEKATVSEFTALLKKHDNINLVGNKVVDIAIEQGKVKTFNEVNGIKFAIVFKI